MTRMKTSVFVSMIAACALIGGCKGMIHVDSVEPTLNPVMDRHDAYVKNDTNLTDPEKSTFLRSTEMLRELLVEAKAKK